MKSYKMKDVHLEIGTNWEIFVAIWTVYDESSDWFKVLSNQEIIDLLNDATITSSKERRLDKSEFKTSLLDFRARL